MAGIIAWKGKGRAQKTKLGKYFEFVPPYIHTGGRVSARLLTYQNIFGFHDNRG